MANPNKSTAAAGIVISALVIAAVAGIGFFQTQVAPQLFPPTSGETTSSSNTGPPVLVVNVTIPAGAAGQPQGYHPGAKTQYGYAPDVITVVLGKNSTVRWVNNDDAPHTATSDTSGLFDTGTISQGGLAQVTFTAAGTYTYHCIFHPWMQGTVIVLPAAP